MFTKEDIGKELERCIECEACMEEGLCPSYTVKKENLYSPLGRLKALEQLIKGDANLDMERAFLTCNGCGRCTEVCPVDINIGELVCTGRSILYQKGILPKESQKRIIDSIFEKGNAVLRDKSKRLVYGNLEYMKFFNRDSDTLLFLGCISSFFHKNAVDKSIKLLDYLGISFRLLEDEGCCGIFLYDGGYFDRAKAIFKKNVDRFNSLGIKRIIVLCPSCYKCFGRYYQELLGEFPFEVVHLIEAVEKELENGKSLPSDTENHFILHEPCKLTRFMGIIEEPRKVLNLSGVKFDEFDENREMSLCCGAGSGVRAYDMDLAVNIAKIVLNRAKGKTIITICPFCTMNLNYASKKSGEKVKAVYISEVLFSDP